MRANISFITLGVADLARSRRYYAAMGLCEHERSCESIVFFDLAGVIFALYERNALAEDAGVLPSEQCDRCAVTISQNVGSAEEVERILACAAKAGGRITQQASEPPWGGVRGYFADPDGHLWEIHWNPGMVIDAAGRMVFGERNATS